MYFEVSSKSMFMSMKWKAAHNQGEATAEDFGEDTYSLDNPSSMI